MTIIAEMLCGVKDKKGQLHEFDVSFDIWEKYRVDDDIPATMNMAGQVDIKL